MDKIVQFTHTPALDRAVTANSRCCLLTVEVLLLSFAVVGIVSCYFAVGVPHTVGAGMCYGVLLFVLYLAVGIHIRFHKRNRGERRHEFHFTDTGFAYSHERESLVPWTEVTVVRKTPVFWAIHFVHSGTSAFVVIPTDVLDDELISIIEYHTGKRGQERD